MARTKQRGAGSCCDASYGALWNPESCDHDGKKNNRVDEGGDIQPLGTALHRRAKHIEQRHGPWQRQPEPRDDAPLKAVHNEKPSGPGRESDDEERSDERRVVKQIVDVGEQNVVERNEQQNNRWKDRSGGVYQKLSPRPRKRRHNCLGWSSP